MWAWYVSLAGNRKSAERELKLRCNGFPRVVIKHFFVEDCYIGRHLVLVSVVVV